MAIFDELKSIGKVLQEAGKIEQYQQILDTQQKLLEMQKITNELQAENRNLKDKLEIKESIIYENNTYWVIRDNNKDGPYCSRCWDVDKNLVRIKRGINNSAFHTCPECKIQVQTGPIFHPTFRGENPMNSSK